MQVTAEHVEGNCKPRTVTSACVYQRVHHTAICLLPGEGTGWVRRLHEEAKLLFSFLLLGLVLSEVHLSATAQHGGNATTSHFLELSGRLMR